jgi:hypothetical protein
MTEPLDPRKPQRIIARASGAGNKLVNSAEMLKLTFPEAAKYYENG